jgi:hypothetical protein
MIFQPGRDFIREWISNLTPDEAQALATQLVEYLYESQDVRLGELAPYWEACGEPLVSGQKIHADSLEYP